MSVFAISFRFSEKRTAHGSYQERYDSFVGAVKDATASAIWDGTSSFILIESAETAAQLKKDFEVLSTFDPDVDLALIINLSQKDYAVLGAGSVSQLAMLMRKR